MLAYRRTYPGLSFLFSNETSSASNSSGDSTMKWFSQTADEGTGTMTSEALQTSALDYRGNGVYRMAVGTGQVEWDIEVGFSNLWVDGLRVLRTALQLGQTCPQPLTGAARNSRRMLSNEIRPGHNKCKRRSRSSPLIVLIAQGLKVGAAFANEAKMSGQVRSNLHHERT
jgi:hypothetical protein